MSIKSEEQLEFEMEREAREVSRKIRALEFEIINKAHMERYVEYIRPNVRSNEKWVNYLKQHRTRATAVRAITRWWKSVLKMRRSQRLAIKQELELYPKFGVKYLAAKSDFEGYI